VTRRLRRPRARTILVPLACLAAGLLVFGALRGTGSPAESAVSGPGQLAGTPLGREYLQKARDTGDATYYLRAEQAFGRALERDPADPEAVAGIGSLQLSRHDFRAALRSGRRALALRPRGLIAYPVLVDALVELGRYDEAERVLQRMVDLRPGLASYSRVSYFRELHGDLDGAASAMGLAVSAGAGAPEGNASVQALLGNVEVLRGRRDAATRAYRAALAAVPGHAPAAAGLARLELAGGRAAQAVRRLDGVVDRLPLPEYVIALGEAQLAAGDRGEARESFELVRVQQAVLSGQRVNTDVELALFESDHGDRRRGVELARRAWAAAPSVRSADALGWALTRAGQAAKGRRHLRRTLALGWREPTVLFHAGMAARASGRRAEARRLLARALRVGRAGGLSPLRAAAARRALGSGR